MGQTNDKVKQGNGHARGRRAAARFNDVRFVQYELDEAERAACKAWDMDAAALFLAGAGLCDDGYTLTLKFDAYSDAYACFVQVRGESEHVNAGLILAGRGSTPEKALKQALFKHHAIGPSWVQYAERRVPVIDD